MQESTASPPPTFFFPLWARIALACFMFAASALEMFDDFSQLNWVMFLALGLFYLIGVPRHKGEDRRACFKKPRAMISFALIIAVVAGALHMLYSLFAKYHS